MFVEDHTSRVAISGLGGMGKTQIALELAYQTKNRCPECSVFWVFASTIEGLRQAYLEIGHQLQIPGLDGEQADIISVIQRHLSREDVGQWLLIFDNADDFEMWIGKANDTAESGLNCRLPKKSGSSIVFTNRNLKIAAKLAKSHVVNIAETDEDMASQMLSKLLINQGLLENYQDSVKLFHQLTFLPLAIVQAAAYINENGITLPKYSSLLEDQEQDVIELLSEEFEDEGRYPDIRNPVAGTWLISLEQIQCRDPLAAEYLSFMSCVDPKCIPQSLLPPAQSRKKEVDAIGTLSAYSFVSSRSVDQSLDMHRLVHLATRNWLRGKNLFDEWMTKVVTRLADVFPDNNPANRPLWRTYLPHARCVLNPVSPFEHTVHRLKLLEHFGFCLQSDGMYDEAEKSFEQVRRLTVEHLGAEHPDTLKSVSNIVLIYFYKGRWKEAEELCMQMFETSKK